jgi:hypothetical protein
MSGNNRKNKARNQTTGQVRHQDDAPWFKNNIKRARRRRKLASQSRKNNRP